MAGVHGNPTKVIGPKTAIAKFLLILSVAGVLWLLFRGAAGYQNTALLNTERIDEIRQDVSRLIGAADESSASTDKDLQNLDQRLTALESANDGRRLAEARKDEAERARRYSAVIALSGRGAHVQRELKELETLLTRWHADLTALQKDDGPQSTAGRRLAASASSIDLFEQLATRQRTGPSMLSTWKQQLMVLLTPVTAAREAEDRNYVVTDEDFAAVERLADLIDGEFRTLRDDRAVLDALIEQSPPASEETPSLGAARKARAMEVRAEQIRQMTQVIEQSRQAARERITGEKKKTDRLLADLAITNDRLEADALSRAAVVESDIRQRQILDQAARKDRAAERQARDAAAVAAKQELRRRYAAAMPEIERLLVPFLTPGLRQLNGREWRVLDEKRPLSLSGMQAWKALENSREGFTNFLWTASGPDNDRPQGVFNGSIGASPQGSEVSVIRRAQVLLTEFGPLLVEDGKLAP